MKISKKRCGDTCVNYRMIRRTRRNVRKTRKIGLSLKSSIQLAQRHLERCNTMNETRMERSLDLLICITRHTLVRKGKHGSIMKLKLDMTRSSKGFLSYKWLLDYVLAALAVYLVFGNIEKATYWLRA
ncbi:hypothetical protein LOK49_LG06G02725 [Camellia lanceoleosa]|uniref:Uncharacterized protein n=1 Tax=Camellia lanceoleosa TaxID=1840588 RepID=A0ACC0HHE6_9ERIC|nr:hypothetical protein LOK49_LG06G02725 [Camellia lanceoleosa]